MSGWSCCGTRSPKQASKEREELQACYSWRHPYRYVLHSSIAYFCTQRQAGRQAGRQTGQISLVGRWHGGDIVVLSTSNTIGNGWAGAHASFFLVCVFAPKQSLSQRFSCHSMLLYFDPDADADADDRR
jgi:hypothetical protein